MTLPTTRYQATRWMRLWGLLAVVIVIAPLVAAAQSRPREARRDSGADPSHGAIQVMNDWRDDINLSMWTHNRDRLGEWSIRPGEQVVLQESGERVRVGSDSKMKVGNDWGWVNVGQVGQFRNGMWYVNVRDVWQATHADRRESGREPARESYREPSDSQRNEPQQRVESPVDQVLKHFNVK